MSVYGGHSWEPEVQHKRRRVDEVLKESILHQEAEMKRLANGRIACLVCPNHPHLDTMPMFMVHRRGSRHQAAAAKREREELLYRQQLQKRIALSMQEASPVTTHTSGLPSNSAPLLVEARKHIALLRQRQREDTPERLGSSADLASTVSTSCRSNCIARNDARASIVASEVASGEQHAQMVSRGSQGSDKPFDHHSLGSMRKVDDDRNAQQENQRQRELELRCRESGWRRDGIGGWFKEENVEFDSDEETPAI